MIYLKTYFYTENEINYINLNLMESQEKIDAFIICEFDFTHTGEERELIFEKNKHLIHPDFLDKIIYFPCRIKDKAKYARDNEPLIHQINEPLMRGYFVDLMKFDDDDIIISVDADEIIYNERYDSIIESVKMNGTIQLELNQLFYKPSYHWVNSYFRAPIATFFKHYKNRGHVNWRYDGKLLNGKSGCHFSWCMGIDEMIYKLNTYSHPSNRKFASEEILKKAIETKTYPFDLNKPFAITEIDRNSEVLPKSIRNEIFDNYWKKFE